MAALLALCGLVQPTIHTALNHRELLITILTLFATSRVFVTLLKALTADRRKALQTNRLISNHRSSEIYKPSMDNLTHLDDPLIKVLLQEKQIFWTTNSHRSDEERHLLWAQRAHQLTSILEPETPRNQHGSSTTSPRRSQAHIPRSVSYGASSAQAPPSAQTFLASDLTRDWSQRSAPAAVPMSRKRSSTSQHGHTPFSSNGPSFPPLAIADFETSHDEPFSNYTIGNATKLRRTGPQRSPLPQVPEVAVYDNPKDWYSRSSDDLDSRPSPSFDSSPTVCCSERRHEEDPRFSPLSARAVSIGNIMPPSQIPSTPTTGELTSGTTLASSMSRQHSLASTDFCFDFSDMLRVNSRISSCSSSGGQSPLEFSQSLAKSNEGGIGLPTHDQVLQFTGGIVNDVHFSSSFSSAPIEAPLLQSSSAVEETGMERSRSDESNTSASSSHLRAARRRSDQLTYASRPIAPKRPDKKTTVSNHPTFEHQMFRIESADGSSKDVAMIPKASYQRPAHPRVKCPRCNERPEGFKGEHELRRHVDRAHGILRKTWVTVDISPDHKFLASCKACRTGKKYGAYYNAAAHLRRTHFNPRKRGRGAKGKNEEKRGGKGGGDHPSMDVLKMWMKEVEEVVLDNMPLGDGSGRADGNSTLEETYADPAAPPMQTTYSNDSSNSGFSDQYNDTQAFDCSPNFDDAMPPSQASLAVNYDDAALQSIEQLFDKSPLDFVNTFPDELIPFIDPLYSSAVSNDGQQTYAGLGGSNFFPRM